MDLNFWVIFAKYAFPGRYSSEIGYRFPLFSPISTPETSLPVLSSIFSSTSYSLVINSLEQLIVSEEDPVPSLRYEISIEPDSYGALVSNVRLDFAGFFYAKAVMYPESENDTMVGETAAFMDSGIPGGSLIHLPGTIETDGIYIYGLQEDSDYVLYYYTSNFDPRDTAKHSEIGQKQKKMVLKSRIAI